jgi:hypothetical protein
MCHTTLPEHGRGAPLLIWRGGEGTPGREFDRPMCFIFAESLARDATQTQCRRSCEDDGHARLELSWEVEEKREMVTINNTVRRGVSARYVSRFLSAQYTSRRLRARHAGALRALQDHGPTLTASPTNQRTDSLQFHDRALRPASALHHPNSR